MPQEAALEDNLVVRASASMLDSVAQQRGATGMVHRLEAAIAAGDTSQVRGLVLLGLETAAVQCWVAARVPSLSHAGMATAGLRKMLLERLVACDLPKAELNSLAETPLEQPESEAETRALLALNGT